MENALCAFSTLAFHNSRNMGFTNGPRHRLPCNYRHVSTLKWTVLDFQIITSQGASQIFTSLADRSGTQLPLPFVFMLDAISVWTLDPAQQTKVAMTCNVTKGEICCHRKLQQYVKSIPPLSQIKSVAF